MSIEAAQDAFGPGLLGLQTGTVVSSDAHSGLGIVEDPAGRRWMFHCTTIVGGSRTIESGALVSFEVRPGGPGRFEAFDIAPLG